jgi:uncharacterized protein
MQSPHLTPFATQRYLSLESFKRDGTPIQTPVWFAEEQGVLYVYTLANAGKVKRIRRNSRIRLAPCTMRGTVIGPWVEAEATIVDATTAAHGHALLRQKYGWIGLLTAYKQNGHSICPYIEPPQGGISLRRTRIGLP